MQLHIHHMHHHHQRRANFYFYFYFYFISIFIIEIIPTASMPEHNTTCLSKVRSIPIVHSKDTRALTFANVCQLPLSEQTPKTPNDSLSHESERRRQEAAKKLADEMRMREQMSMTPNDLRAHEAERRRQEAAKKAPDEVCVCVFVCDTHSYT